MQTMKKEDYLSLQSSKIEGKTGTREEANGMEGMKMCLISLRPVQKQAIDMDANELFAVPSSKPRGNHASPCEIQDAQTIPIYISENLAKTYSKESHIA